MKDIFNALVPEDYKTTQKLFMYYLKTLQDKLYKVSLPDLSMYEIQILKQGNLFFVAVHGHYITQTSKVTFPQIEQLIKEIPAEQANNNELFLLDLRF